MRQWLCTGLALLVGACATPAPIARNATEPPTWGALAPFSGETEFRAYVRDLEAADRARNRATNGGKLIADPDCPPDQVCPEEESVVVTASRISAPAPVSVNTAITNVQTAGVDEGDIVKMIGPYLIVLQDGRLFSINTGASSADLALTDRINIYRKGSMDAWYDEILVHENRIVATSYNYDHDATEFSIFSLSPEGRFTREGAYFVSSGDYYDSENYATRLVNGNLVIYSPVALDDLDLDADDIEWPRVRRLVRTLDEEEQLSIGRPLVTPRNIYRPIQATFDPTFHTIAVCPLGSTRAGDELECRTTAIAGPRPREFYVSNDHLYLWTWPRNEGYGNSAAQEAECAARPKNSFQSATPSAIFQVDLATGRPRALFVRGGPNDQLGMEATATEFRALALWVDPRCNALDNTTPVRYFSTPLADFSTTPQSAPENAFTRLPSVMGSAMENRFTAGHLVYGGRTRWSSYMDEDEVEEVVARVVVVPSSNPGAAQALDAPHNVIRVESIGEDAIITGYHSRDALSMSVIDLSGAPRVADTTRLAGRFETEGRSHAFNYTLAADGSGTLAIPTGEAQWRSGRWVWDSESSDVSFIALSADHRLAPLGELSTKDASEHPSYECEVSCIDWYGNSRPIFIGPRIFALSGTEIIEGRVRDGRIDEMARVNLTAPPPRH
ncbi:beta-propeller domain-containing protein [Vitreimonas flagellata]|uniref:beta-propeller domain-containing protein n=1 Tax=Vitreimonas flagellata TaxID=2560861 RepID=UPI001074BA72|nr:beta-propeller domain-containing protein [Vitreimonas flagellata]